MQGTISTVSPPSRLELVLKRQQRMVVNTLFVMSSSLCALAFFTVCLF